MRIMKQSTQQHFSMFKVLQNLHPDGIQTDGLLFLKRMRCHQAKPSHPVLYK
jgi:hypothetical protein